MKIDLKLTKTPIRIEVDINSRLIVGGEIQTQFLIVIWEISQIQHFQAFEDLYRMTDTLINIYINTEVDYM